MSYFKFNQKIITDFSEQHISEQYNQGYVFTRLGKGTMDQTRSVRIDLSKFEMSSENRRIYKKMNLFTGITENIPFENYTWKIAKMAKDFYDTKFEKGTFSANKIKKIITDETISNFNMLIAYRIVNERKNILTIGEEYPIQIPIFLDKKIEDSIAEGYTICLETCDILHYSYPFYNLHTEYKNMGMSMMLYAILWAKYEHKKYIYLGSAQRPTDSYKLQFKGLEWFDGQIWKDDIDELKNILKGLI